MSMVTTLRSVSDKLIQPLTSRGLNLLPYMVFALSLAMTLYSWRLYDTELKSRAEMIFKDKTEEITSSIIKSLHANEQILRGAGGLFNASRNVSRDEWQRYITTLKLGEYYPGILGVGFSQWIPAQKKMEHIRSIRASGFPNYTIHPEGEREGYSSIIYLEPFDKRNQRAFGYDMFSEPIRREAMERARDTARTSISSKIILVQESDSDKQNGFLIYVPVYRSETPMDTVAARRAALVGFVYSPIRCKDFIYATLGEMPIDISFELFTSEEETQDSLLFSSIDPAKLTLPEGYRPTYQNIKKLEAFGNNWQIAFKSLPLFQEEMRRTSSYAALAGGILVSCLLTMISLMLQSAHNKAIEAAETHRAGEELVRRKLKTIIEPEGDIGELTLADILDRNAVQSMMNDFYRITGFGIGIIDLSGNVLVGTGWQDICTKFHRVNPETTLHCIESDTLLTRGVTHGEVKEYHCKNNMWDLVTPLMVGGKHLGNIFLGQFFYDDETPDYELFRQQARRYQFDEKEYMAAVDKVPRWSRENVATVVAFYAKFADMVSSLGYSSIKIARSLEEQKRLENERLQMEQQLLHAQKLESLGILAGGIAHDFNNILTSIVGNTELALMQLSPESPALENLYRIEKAAARATDLAKQMLAYSGKGKFVVEPIDLNCLIEEMGHMLEVSISKKAIIEYNLAPALPTVDADGTQLRQVIMNLVINASEAIGDQTGVISISTGYLDCTVAYLQDVWSTGQIPAGRYVYLEISDTGCGMEKEIIAKIFDPFFTTKFTGRGLGMAAVLGIIRGHKGAIKIYSEPSKGSSFKVLLPAGNMPAEPVKTGQDVSSWRGSGIVLLVDDEQTIRDIGGQMLGQLGFGVITANDGCEALEAYKNTPGIRFVILDLTMPRMDGEQCFRELKQLDPQVKVIITSGFSEHDVTQKFSEKGIAGFIQKPYRIASLQKALQEL